MISVAKRCAVLTLILVCNLGFLNTAQGVDEEGFLYSDMFFDVAVKGKNTYMVGYRGRVFKSQDQGKSWVKLDSGTEEPLFRVFFIGPDKGWAVGEFGTILHTRDGGKSWAQQKAPTEHLLRDIYFLDENRGWAVGIWSTILATHDGGKTWTDRSIEDGMGLGEKDRILTSIYFTDPTTGWAVGEFKTILHTTDGGQTWVMQAAEVPEKAYFTQVLFKDANEGWVIGNDGFLLYTKDGGEDWTVLESGTRELLNAITIKGEKLFAVGNKGSICVSQDGGRTWEKFTQEKGDTPHWWLAGLDFKDDYGIIVGGHATVLRSENGGDEWHVWYK